MTTRSDTRRAAIRRALTAKCNYDFLTMGGAVKPPTSHDASTRRKAKLHLRENGWGYHAAANELGTNFVSIEKILNGRRYSPVMINRLLALPPCPQPTPNAGIKYGRDTR